MTETLTQSAHQFQHISPHLLTIIQRFADESKHLLKEEIIAEDRFGSYAKNTDTPLSDIDILSLEKANDVLQQAE